MCRRHITNWRSSVLFVHGDDNRNVPSFAITLEIMWRTSNVPNESNLRPSCRNSDGQRPEVCPNVVRPVTCFEIAGLPRELFERFTLGEGKPQIPSPVNRIAPKPSRLTNRSPPNKNVSPLLLVAAISFDNPPVKTPAAPAEIAPKTFLVSSQIKYVAATNAQLHLSRRSFTEDGTLNHQLRLTLI